MCDKMVAGKKYLVWGCVWRKVCVCKERGVDNEQLQICNLNCAENIGLILVLQDWEWDKFHLPPIVQ